MKSMKFIITILLLSLNLCFCFPTKANPGGHYWISFTNKVGTPYSVNRPEQFLSGRSIERRLRQSIPITQTDLPPNPSYVIEVRKIRNIRVLYTSRWFNGTLVFSQTGEGIEAVTALPFVSKVELVKPLLNKNPGPLEIFYITNKFETVNCIEPVFEIEPKKSHLEIDLGLMAPTIHQLNGQSLINRGYWGRGKMIGVLDAGFTNVDRLRAFEHLRADGRLRGVKDFVNPQQNVFNSHAHGTVVLSVMAADVSGQLFGTAKGADYWLIRTEDGATEYKIEEYNWLAGAELADSAGVDIINSSLGYTEFDAPWQNYNYQQMNGNTTVVARSANFAHERGMVVVASAGNSALSPWHHIVSPSDAFGALSVGAVSAEGIRAPFSSVGPSADLRVKPDIMAHGWAVPVVPPSGNIGLTSGTSLSSPVISGLIASLWQKFPHVTAKQIYQAVRASSSQYYKPDPFLGYGIPDFAVASKILASTPDQPNYNRLSVFPNPFSGCVKMVFFSETADIANIDVFDLSGQKVNSIQNFEVISGANVITGFDLSTLENGIFVIRITTQKKGAMFTEKVLKAGL